MGAVATAIAVNIPRMKTAANLVLVGPMGAGKTVVGSRLAARIGLDFVDLDAAIERDAGASIRELFEREGEAGFRERERLALAAALTASGRLVATGGGAVLDARNREAMRRHGFVAWLQAGIEAQLLRLADARDRPLLQDEHLLHGDDRAARLQQLAAIRAPLYAEAADLVVDTDQSTTDQVVATLERMLPDCWRRGETAA